MFLLQLKARETKKEPSKPRPCLILEQEGNLLIKTLYWPMELGHMLWNNPSQFTMLMEPKTKLE